MTLLLIVVGAGHARRGGWGEAAIVGSLSVGIPKYPP